MTIVLNENEWAKEMISLNSLGKKPFETLSRIAKYYLDEGRPKKEVRGLLDLFLIRCDTTVSLPKWSELLDKAMERAMKYDAIKIDYIEITQPELQKIEELKGKQIRRLAFTLLCLSKYWNAVNPKANHWVNNKDSDIMRMANINTSIKRQSMMYHELNKLGMIQFSKKVDNTSVRILFSEPGEVAMRISDFRNLGYQYLQHIGEPYFKCENCGLVTRYDQPKNKKSTIKQKYCKECAYKIKIQQTVNSVMRQRNSV